MDVKMRAFELADAEVGQWDWDLYQERYLKHLEELKKPRRVAMFSGGETSWAAAKLDAERNGVEGLTLLFADTREEDADTYRFRDEAASNVGAPLVVVSDGRSLWELFRQERMIGNSRVDLCSRVLKRDLCDAWLEANCDPKYTTVLLGYNAEEMHRFIRGQARYASKGWKAAAPLCEAPVMSAGQVKEWARKEGLVEQRLYKLGFPHANCGGFCVKAGQAHFRHLLQVLPEVYKRHEQEEQSFREAIGKDVSVMRDRRGGKTRPLTMREFRENIEANKGCDAHDWGGCGCFSADEFFDD